MQKTSIFILAFLLLFSGAVVLAQENGTAEALLDEDVLPEDLDITEPNLLPDSPFYFFKNMQRSIQSFFTFDPMKKLELKERFTNQRLIELRKMNKEGKSTEDIQKAAEGYQDELAKLKEAAEKAKEKLGEDGQIDTFLDKLIQHQALHQRILQKLEEQVPEEAFAKIKEARERHLERFSEVMTKLEEDPEKIKEALEENIQKIEGSQFKEFKNVEFLENLQEKVPEKIKEIIEEVKENSVSRLQVRIEGMTAEKLEEFKDYTEKISGEEEGHVKILNNLKNKLEEVPQIQAEIIQQKEKIEEKIRTRVQNMLNKEN